MPRKLKKQEGQPWKCPGCRKKKLVTIENWYRAKDGRWAGSCRVCSNTRKNKRLKTARQTSKAQTSTTAQLAQIQVQTARAGTAIAGHASVESQHQHQHQLELQKRLEVELSHYLTLKETAVWLALHKEEFGLALTPNVDTLKTAARKGRLVAVFKSVYLTTEEALRLFAKNYRPQARTSDKIREA